MINVTFSGIFVSKGYGLRSDDKGNQVKYFFVNISTDDGSVERLSVSDSVFRDLEDVCLSMGDKVSVLAELRQVSAERKWFLRPTIIQKE